MSHMRYNRAGSKKSSSSSSSSCHGTKGFRLNPRRFSVQRLRTKFLFLVRLFNKWKNSYGQASHALRSLRRNLAKSNRSRSSCKKDQNNQNNTSSRRNLVVMKELQKSEYCSLGRHGCSSSRLRSFARSNSFYTEAIADCLDFIKRNSISMDENPVLNQIYMEGTN